MSLIRAQNVLDFYPTWSGCASAVLLCSEVTEPLLLNKLTFVRQTSLAQSGNVDDLANSLATRAELSPVGSACCGVCLLWGLSAPAVSVSVGSVCSGSVRECVRSPRAQGERSHPLFISFLFGPLCRAPH